MSASSETVYQYNADEVTVMQNMLGRLSRLTGTNLEASLPTIAGQQAFVLRVNDAGLGVDRDLLSIRASRNGAGAPVFDVRDFGDRPIGPSGTYTFFVEALMHAETFAGAVIESAKEQRAERMASEAGKASGSTFNSGILSAKEIELVHAFANGIGNAAKARGFAKFVEARAGVLSIALGFLDHQDNPIMLGSLVAASKPDGSYECSVWGPDNSQIPGPDIYVDVTAALTATQPYFAYMASKTGKLARPSLLGRLRRNVGL